MVGTNWGLDSEKIRWIYTAIINPIITYASVCWASRSVTKHPDRKLKPLKRVERMATTMISKSYNSASQEALLIILDLLPINLQLEKSAVLTALSLKAQNHWDFQDIDITKNLNFETNKQILDKLLDNIFEDKLNIPEIKQNNGNTKYVPDQIRPNLIIDKNYSTNIATGKKHNRSLNIPNTDTIVVFTDGSKQENGDAGYGITMAMDTNILTEDYNRLDTHSTIFQCELYAIYRTASLLLDLLTTHKYIYIYSDSQSAIKALSTTSTDSITVYQCHIELNKLGERNNISIDWVPGHHGYDGNERADKLANQGTKMALSHHHTLPFSKSVMKTIAKEYYKNRQKINWSGNNISDNCKIFINPLLSMNINIRKKILTLSTKNLTSLTKLITGHNNLNYFQHTIGNAELNTCQFCDEDELETSFHILCECPVFTVNRMRYFGESPTTIQQIYNLAQKQNTNFKFITKYIEEIDLENFYW